MAWSEDLILDVLNYLVVISEIIMLQLACSGFFERRRSQTIMWLSVAGLTLAVYLMTQLLLAYTITKAVVICAIIWIWVMLSFDAQIVSSIFVTVFFQAYMYIADSCFVLATSFAFDVSSSEMMNSPASFYLLVSLSKCMEMIGIILLRRWAKRKFAKTAESWQDWFRSAFTPISSLLIGVFILRIFRKEPDLANELMCCSFILLFTNMSAVVLLEKLEERQIIIRNNAILRQNLKKEQESLSLWTEAYQDQRKQTHDFQNHLSVIRGMAGKELSYNEITTYVDNLISVEYLPYMQISTRRSVVDILVNQKYTLAQKNGIRFELQLDDLSTFPLSDDALTIVLGNLLDNAISACCEVPVTERRVIKLKMETSESASYLYIENPTGQPVSVVENRVIQDVDPITGHGFGLQNVRTILEEYDAEYIIDYITDRGAFVVSAQFFA